MSGNQPDWCSERFGFVTVPKDGSRDFRKLSSGPWCSWVEAQTKIEQLTRERDEARTTVQLTETLTARVERLARGRVEEERDRLRAALEDIANQRNLILHIDLATSLSEHARKALLKDQKQPLGKKAEGGE